MDSPMTKTQVEVITSVERRRRWSRAEKELLVAASIEPGAVASEVARAAGYSCSRQGQPLPRALSPLLKSFEDFFSLLAFS